MIWRVRLASNSEERAGTVGGVVYVYDYVYVEKRLKDKKQDVELLVEGEKGQVDED